MGNREGGFVLRVKQRAKIPMAVLLLARDAWPRVRIQPHQKDDVAVVKTSKTPETTDEYETWWISLEEVNQITKESNYPPLDQPQNGSLMLVTSHHNLFLHRDRLGAEAWLNQD